MLAILENNTVCALADAAIAADTLHSSLCLAGAPDAALEAPLLDHAAALEALADTAATSHADIVAKAQALKTTLLSTDGGVPTVEGDCGLAASLIRDLCA